MLAVLVMNQLGYKAGLREQVSSAKSRVDFVFKVRNNPDADTNTGTGNIDNAHMVLVEGKSPGVFKVIKDHLFLNLQHSTGTKVLKKVLYILSDYSMFWLTIPQASVHMGLYKFTG
jgi:hypothetical protein